MMHSFTIKSGKRRLHIVSVSLSLCAMSAGAALAAPQADGGGAGQGTPVPTAPSQTPPMPPAGPPPEIPPPVPAPNALTLQQAVDFGLRNNPQVTQAHFQVESAHENLNSQRAPINPTVQYAGLNNTVGPADIASGFSQLANYSAYVTVETNGAEHWRTATARNQFHQAQFDAQTTRLGVKLGVINAYVALQVANKALQIEQEVYANARQLSDLTSQRFQLGAAPQADAIRAQIAFIQEGQNLLTNAANVRSARAALNAQLGRAADAPVDAIDPLVYKPAVLPDVAELDRRALARRPEIQSADANTAALKATTHLEQTQYYPDVIVGRDFAGNSPVELGLSIPIDLGNIRGAVKKAKADASAQAAAAESQRQSVQLDVQTSYISLVAARAQVDSYESGILKQSEQLLTQTKQGYTLGASTILDLITAESTYRATLTAYYSAVGNYVQAVYQLEHSIGAPLDAAPGTSLTAVPAPIAASQAIAAKVNAPL